jgi:hypothetical protein
MPRHNRQSIAELERELLPSTRLLPVVVKIMVDELAPTPNAEARCFRAGSCHLTIDGPIEALHHFARRLGLRRSWFQEHRVHPHYDLTAQKRAKALELGATFVPAKEQAKARMRKLGALK